MVARDELATTKLIAESSFIQQIKRKKETWFCCNEAAVYFAAKYRTTLSDFHFQQICFDMLTKLEMADILDKKGIPVIPKKKITEFHSDYPVIAKPNFGFASTLVKKINSAYEFENYLENFNSLWKTSEIKTYQEKYFSDKKISFLKKILIEPDLSSGTFLSVPFIVKDKSVVNFFPVQGNSCQKSQSSDYSWHSFVAPADISTKIHNKIHDILNRIALHFASHDAVFHVEIIVDASDNVWILEFSPRISGKAICELLFHSTGIELEKQAIALACRVDFHSQAKWEKKCMFVKKQDSAISQEKVLCERKNGNTREYIIAL